MGPATPFIVAFVVSTVVSVGLSLVLSALFPVKIEGPRLSDLRIQVSTYGNPIPIVYGSGVRIAGNVIWSTGLIETAGEDGGKGGPSVTSYSYRTSVAIALCEGIAIGVKKIWANGKLIYDTDLATAGATDQAVLTPEYAGVLGGIAIFKYRQLETQAIFESITFYPGTFDQDIDPLMESYLGVGNVPAYRGIAYIVIKNLQLADFGNRLPNLEFLVEKNRTDDVGTIVTDIADRCGIPEANVSVCDLTLTSYVIGRQSTGHHAILPLAAAFNFDIADDAGTLRMVHRDRDPSGTILLDDMGAHAAGSERVPPIEWLKSRVTALPRELSVAFPDPDRDYQENVAVARRSEGTADASTSIEIPIPMSVSQAARIADRLLWEAWVGQQAATTSVSDKHIDVRPAMTYLFETPAGYEPMRVFNKTRGTNGIINLELRRDRVEVYQSTSSGVSAAVPPNTIAIPGPTELVLLDIPILRDVDDDPGFYYAVIPETSDWRGAQVLRALAVDEDYLQVGSLGVTAVVGDVSGTVADGTTVGFDDVTVIEVTLRGASMTLSSVDDAALAAGFNTFFIGDPNDTTLGEILQAGTVTFPGSGDTYLLSHLKRGLKGTEFATSLHGPNEILVALNETTLRRANYGVVDLNLARFYKAVSLLWSAVDVAAVSFTNTGVGLRPYAPENLAISGVTSFDGDLTLTWERRSRLTTEALGEAFEQYTVQILTLSGFDVLREAVATSEQFVYTEEMQIEDFGEPVAGDLHWRVAQVSAIYGNGIFAEMIG